MTMFVRQLFCGALLILAPAAHAEAVRIGGTGITLGVSRLVGEKFMATQPATQIEVLPSLGSTGGIRALLDNDLQIALTTRPPDAGETANGLRSAACYKTALVFATSRSSAPGMRLADVPAQFADAAPKWPDGQPLKVILRARSGSENALLIARVPAFAEAFKTAYARTGMPVGATDQENVEIALRTQGSLAIASLLQIRAEKLNLVPLALDGVAPNDQTVADGSYPMPLMACFLIGRNVQGGTLRFIDFLLSTEGEKVMRENGAAPLG